MLKKIIIFFMILAILLLGGILYLNKVFLPIQLRAIINQKSREYLQREITYKEIVFQPLKGLVIKNLVIYQKNDSQTPFLTVEEAYARILLPSIFKEFKLLVPSIILDKPFLHLIRSSDGKWNYTDVLTPSPAVKRKESPVMIGGITVNNGKIQITDRYVNPFSIEVWEEIDTRISFSLNKTLKFDTALTNTAQKAYLKAAGHFALASLDLSARIEAQNLNVAKYLNLFYLTPEFLLREGFIEQAKLSLSRQKSSQEIRGDLLGLVDIQQGEERKFKGRVDFKNLTFSQENNNFSLGGQLATKGLDIRWDGGKILQGSMATHNLLASAKEQKLIASGDIELIDGLAQWSEKDKARGNFLIKDLLFNKEQEDFNLGLNLTSPKAELTIQENNFSGRISLPDLKVSRKNDAFSVMANLELGEALVIIGTQARFSTNLLAKNLNIRGTVNNFQANGELALTNPVLSAKEFSLKGDLLSLPLEVISKDQKITFSFAPILSNADIRLASDKYFKSTKLSGQELSATLSDGKIRIKGNLITEQAFCRIAKDQEFQGNPTVKIDLTVDPQKPGNLIYRGALTLNSASFKGAPVLGDVQQITGTVHFENDLVSTDKLDLTANNTVATVAGSVSNFQSPLANLKISTENIDLTKIQPYLEPYLQKINIQPSGQADIRVNFNGPLSKPQNAKLTATAVLRNGTLEGKDIPGKISQISGLLSYTGDRVSWQNLKGTWGNKTYTLNGDLDNFKDPSIRLQVGSEDLILKSVAKLSDNILTLSSFSGRFMDSAFDLKGTFHLKDSADPYLDVTGHVTVNLADLPSLNPAWKNLKDLHLSGDLSSDFYFKGRPKDFSRAKITLTATSPLISVNTYQLNDLAVDFRHGETEFGKIKINAKFYNGTVNIDGFTNRQEDPATIHLTGQLTDTDLAEIRKDGKWSGQNVRGTLSSSLELDGPMADPNQLHGRCSFSISDGILWEMNFLKGIWKLLLIPELEKVTFTDAAGNFVIQNSKLLTNDLFFKGNMADLMGKGWIDFKGNLNLDIAPKIKQLEILQSASLKKSPTSILTDIDALTIKITGTTKQPKYQLSSLPTKVLQKATDTIIQGVQDIFEGIINK